MTTDAHSFLGYDPKPLPQPSITAALNNVRLFRAGLGRSISKQELQADVLALDAALRESLADRDLLCIRAAVNATSDQADYIAALEAVVDVAVKFTDGDASTETLINAVIEYAANNIGADQ